LYMNALSAEKSIVPARFDENSKTLLLSETSEFPGVDGNIMQGARQKLIDDNQMREEYKVISGDGDTTESIEITLQRMVGSNKKGLYF